MITPRRTLGLGVALLVVAVFSPLASWGEHRSFAAHMAQHLLLGDIAPLALAVAVGRAAAPHPAIALPVWAVNLAVWHVPAVYEAPLHHEAVHVLQHAALFAAGALLWSAVLSRRWSVPARLGAVAGMMLVNLGLSTVLLWWPHVLYSTYRHARTLGGISPLSDQRLGGGLMLLEGSIVAFAVAGWLILQLLREQPVSAAAGDVSRSP
ncbi:MAG TPA: cytochrome c oxidase assembly protein [Gaiellaceae bacterium]|nr:cytochrome c oxidase assembly protein [Gaiellaceae bacterium]